MEVCSYRPSSVHPDFLPDVSVESSLKVTQYRDTSLFTFIPDVSVVQERVNIRALSFLIHDFNASNAEYVSLCKLTQYLKQLLKTLCYEGRAVSRDFDELTERHVFGETEHQLLVDWKFGPHTFSLSPNARPRRPNVCPPTVR